MVRFHLRRFEAWAISFTPLCLIEGIANEKVVIMTKLQSSLTNKKKKEVWREITAKVNAFGVALRTEDDIKKKWMFKCHMNMLPAFHKLSLAVFSLQI